jgi:hypothetical protein
VIIHLKKEVQQQVETAVVLVMDVSTPNNKMDSAF